MTKENSPTDTTGARQDAPPHADRQNDYQSGQSSHIETESLETDEIDLDDPLLGDGHRDNERLLEKRTRGTGPTSPLSERKAQALVRHVEGGSTLAEAARREGIPESTAYRWLKNHPRLSLAVNRARRAGAHARVDALLDMVRDRTRDLIETVDSKGATRVTPNPTAVNRDRLILDAEMRVLAVIDPETWGQRSHLELHNRDDRTDEEKALRLLTLLAEAASNTRGQSAYYEARKALLQRQRLARAEAGEARQAAIAAARASAESEIEIEIEADGDD